MTWPISFADVVAARERLRPYLTATPLREYAALNEEIGGPRLLVKHENHLPTNAFKVRNTVSALTLLDPEQRRRGVIAATRGNHGQGLAWAGRELGVPVTICVPRGNSPEKNRAVVGFGAELLIEGRDYDESVQVAQRIAAERGLHVVHSTNDAAIIAGAATLTLEIIEAAPDLEAMVIAVGGGSQAVGALTVLRERAPAVEVYGVQAAGAAAAHDGWHAGKPVTLDRADTFADGLATRGCYDMTFPALRAGLRDFVTVSDEEIGAAIRVLLSCTHNLAEGAGAAGLAGARKLAERLRGRRTAVVLSGGNIDRDVLARVVDAHSTTP